MIGIVESGSTKTQWLFIDKNKKQYASRTVGFNPFYQSPDDICKTLKNDLLPQLEFSDSIEKIFYYGAGCEAEGNKEKVRQAFKMAMPSTNVHVMHDLLAAAKALFGDKPGLACIAGTGSNTCYYDGKDVVKNVHSLGLFMGDEGSGGYKGKLLISKYIRKQLPSHLMKAFEEEYADRTDTILSHVYGGEMPSRYLASFAPFLKKHLSEPEIYKIVWQSFEEMFDNCIVHYDNYKNVPLGFVGSIAYHFRDVLHKVAEKKGAVISIIDPNPSEALAKYHLAKEFMHEHH
jgi:N-acetylglucosamine kinase-like BadF-type ATPase